MLAVANSSSCRRNTRNIYVCYGGDEASIELISTNYLTLCPRVALATSSLELELELVNYLCPRVALATSSLELELVLPITREQAKVTPGEK